MATEIYLAKFIPDMRRGEPRNVGVIVRKDGRAAGRFIGERADGTIDGRVIASLGAPAALAVVETYRMWVEYWRRIVIEGGEVTDPVKRGANAFYLTKAGEIWLGEDEALDALVERYFAELVQSPG